jgi:hypothetical protein
MIDFYKADEQIIKDFLNSIKFNMNPESNLIVKKSILKKETGAFKGFKEATAILTRDK